MPSPACPAKPTPHRSSLCLARQRLGLAPVRRLFERVVRLLATPPTPGAFYQGWRLMAVGRHGLQRARLASQCGRLRPPSGGHRGDGACPQVRKLSLVEVGTHVEVAFVVKGIKGPQQRRAAAGAGLFRHLRPDMLLLWDRGFFSYWLWKSVVTTGCQLLARVQQSAGAAAHADAWPMARTWPRFTRVSRSVTRIAKA